MLVLTCILYIPPYVRVDKQIKGMLKYMYMYLRTVLVKTTQVKIRAFQKTELSYVVNRNRIENQFLYIAYQLEISADDYFGTMLLISKSGLVCCMEGQLEHKFQVNPCPTKTGPCLTVCSRCLRPLHQNLIIIYIKYHFLSLQIFTCVLASMQTVCSIEDTFKVKI